MAEKRKTTKKRAAPKKKAVKKRPARRKRKTTKKKPVKKKVKRKGARTAKLKKIRAEPIVTVKRERLTPASFTTVSQKVSEALGVDVKIVRVVFLISFVCLIGIPVYLLLSLFMRD
jgi:hypothetical protein